MTIKVSLAAQIQEAERWVEAGKKAAETNPNVLPTLDAAQAIVISLHTFAGLYDTDRMEGRDNGI